MTAPSIGLAEAARISGVSESTIRRKRVELLELGASQGPKGWSIPIPALVELGLLDSKTAPDTVTAPEAPPASRLEPLMTPSAGAELEALRKALTAAELRAAVAEAVAAERERIIEAQVHALRLLEAPVRRSTDQSTVLSQSSTLDTEDNAASQQTPSRRSWWPFRQR